MHNPLQLTLEVIVAPGPRGFGAGEYRVSLIGVAGKRRVRP